MAAAALKLDQHEFSGLLIASLGRAYGRERSVVKVIARAANANEHTVKNWLAGRALPDCMHMLRLMAVTPELKAQVAQLTRMQIELDPEAERAMSALAQLLMRRRP